MADDSGNSLSTLVGSALDWLLPSKKEAPRESLTPAPAPTNYPSLEDAAAATQAGFGYGSGNELFFNGARMRDIGHPRGSVANVLSQLDATPVTDTPPDRQKELADTWMRAGLVANRSPITAVGFDPTKVGLESTDKQLTLGGLYAPKQDQIYANTASLDGIVHESTHRGLQKMREAGLFTEEEQKWLAQPQHEEYLIRHLMQKYAGNPVPDLTKPVAPNEPAGQRVERSAAWWFGKYNPNFADYRSKVESLERKAQNFRAAQRERGPR